MSDPPSRLMNLKAGGWATLKLHYPERIVVALTGTGQPREGVGLGRR